MQQKLNQKVSIGLVARLMVTGFIVSAFVLGLANLGLFSADAQDDDSNLGATATLQDVDGNSVGVVTLTTQAGKVVLIAQLNDLPPGFHGFHVHLGGSCEDTGDGPFSGAGLHLNPNETEHPDHVGDLPPVLVMEDGTAFLSVATDRFTIAELFDADGSSIVIHSGPDNFANIPDRYEVTPDAETTSGGDSGEPLACGVFQESVRLELPTETTTPSATTGAPVEETPTALPSATSDMTTTPDSTTTATGTLTPEGTLETPSGSETPTETPTATSTSAEGSAQ
jgi:Cu-Zn family superoxide dismutase